MYIINSMRSIPWLFNVFFFFFYFNLKILSLCSHSACIGIWFYTFQEDDEDDDGRCDDVD